MNNAEFRHLLESCTTLSDKQRAVLQSTLNRPFCQRSCLLYERLEDNFAANPVCQHCNSDNVRSLHWKVDCTYCLNPALLQKDQAEQLRGIVELDETFFRESHKGSRTLPFQREPRKRGGVRKKRLKAGQVHRREPPVKKVPVLVAGL